MRSTLTVFVGACLVGLPMCLAAAESKQDAESPIGKKIEDFKLQDYRGQWHSLDDFRDKKIVVVAFLGIECPLVRVYAPRLVELAKEFESHGVAFIGINPNRQDSIVEMGHFARANKIHFPLLKDVGNVVADKFGAIRVPEMFVLDENRVVRYWGRVDEQYGFQYGVGYQLREFDRRDLAEAVAELLAGKEVSVPVTPALGCHIGRIWEPDPDAKVTYSNQIARVFQDRCVECHRPGQIAPYAMSSYDEVVGWAAMIEEVVRENRMPPWYADPEHGTWANDCRLTDEERQLIFDWVAAGAPEGDPADLPEPKEFVEGWALPKEPDCVIHMADEPFTVPAEGTIEYQYFEVDPGFEEDVFVQAAECMPDARPVVHHIIVYIKPPSREGEVTPEGIPARHLLAGTAPGNPPVVLPEGMAMRIPAGSKLIFEMHYTAVGQEMDDRSSIGLILADPKDVKQEVMTGMAINTWFEIPAGAQDHRVDARKRFLRGGHLVFLMPHMHLRGKAFQYNLIYPDGSRETLLDIPRYDFNWQNSYYFEEPKYVPKGTRMECIALFDNSEENHANPDPTQAVGWGEQTWEEMMIGWFVWAPEREESPPAGD